jgi:hypothetical protein
MNRIHRTLAIAGAAGATLLGGAALTGIAGAQEPDEPTADAPADAPAAAPEGAERCGPGGRRGPNLEVAAEAIGIDADALREALQGGSTLSDVAEANGVDPQVVVDALLADVEDHLAEEVAEGDLTQAEADERLAEATERIPQRVHEGRPEHGERPEAPAEPPAEVEGS